MGWVRKAVGTALSGEPMRMRQTPLAISSGVLLKRWRGDVSMEVGIREKSNS
jgi:hypothetical protein